MKMMLLALILMLVSCSGSSKPQKCMATLTWATPTERLDGTPLSLSELSKITIYMSEQEDTDTIFLERVEDLHDVNFITWELKNLPPGQHWFYITVTDIENHISPFSNILGKIC